MIFFSAEPKKFIIFVITAVAVRVARNAGEILGHAPPWYSHTYSRVTPERICWALMRVGGVRRSAFRGQLGRL
jgi:hypothetical protein